MDPVAAEGVLVELEEQGAAGAVFGVIDDVPAEQGVRIGVEFGPPGEDVGEVGFGGGSDGDLGPLVGEVDRSGLVGAVGESGPVGSPAAGEGGVAAGELVEGDLEFPGEESGALQAGLGFAGLVAPDLSHVDPEDFGEVVDADAEFGPAAADDVRGSH